MAALVGVLIGMPSLKLKGDYLAIVTLAFGEIVRAILRLIQPIGGARGMIGIPNYSNFAWILFFMALTLYLLRNLIYSPYGRAFIAIRDNEIAADAMGINTTRYKITSFCIAAFIAGVAGGLYAHVLAFIQPDSFSFTKSSDFLVYLYAGGSGSLTGSILGATLLTILPEVLRFLADWRLAVYAAYSGHCDALSLRGALWWQGSSLYAYFSCVPVLRLRCLAQRRIKSLRVSLSPEKGEVVI